MNTSQIAYIEGGKVCVIEIESSTSRKGFIRGYLKAKKHFQDTRDGRGGLLFIITEEKRNLDPIIRQLALYHDWLHRLGVPVRSTYLIYDTALSGLVSSNIELLSTKYLARATAVK